MVQQRRGSNGLCLRETNAEILAGCQTESRQEVNDIEVAVDKTEPQNGKKLDRAEDEEKRGKAVMYSTQLPLV